MKTIDIDNIRLVSATYLRNYVIRFVFSDGKNHDLDFFPFLSRTPQNPMTSKYLNLDLFKQFKTDSSGDISWNNGEMCYGLFTTYYGFGEDMKQEARYYRTAPVISRLHFPQTKKRKKEYA